MAVLSSQKTSLPSDKFLQQVTSLVPQARLRESEVFMWSPKDKTIHYAAQHLGSPSGQWSLLHEAAHAALGHRNYESDFELLQLEVAAWTQAKQLGATLHIEIDTNHIEDCLDTYRDWLHQRSTCPTCGNGGIQHSSREYRCHNCLTTWHVSPSRFCRPYRMKQISGATKKSPNRNQTTFQ